MTHKYPIYIVSKGRWESRLTSRALEKMNTDYKIVVEPQEYGNYAKVIDPKKILTLPFSNLGQGSIPARNWIWEHALSQGSKKHWILDDNIRSFVRTFNNKKIKVLDDTCFQVVEDFTDRYENVALSGMQYGMFLATSEKYSNPFTANTRIYSCILIRNDIPYRWRGKYNEDTDLSIRVLKDGWCTILIYAFLAYKNATLKMKGGNMDELYKDKEKGRLEMAKSLQHQHPDIVKIKWKWGRWQHSVDYSRFRYNRLKLKEGIKIEKGINEYGLKLISL